jgi:acyl carrier protein
MLENCESAVIEIIEKALRLDDGVIKIDSSSENMDDWDSLGQLSILVALDKHFEGKISRISEMAEANSVSKILHILEENSIC